MNAKVDSSGKVLTRCRWLTVAERAGQRESRGDPRHLAECLDSNGDVRDERTNSRFLCPFLFGGSVCMNRINFPLNQGVVS